MPLNRITTIILANKNSFMNEFRKKETVNIQFGMQKCVSFIYVKLFLRMSRCIVCAHVA